MNAQEIEKQSNRYWMQGLILTLMLMAVVAILDRFTSLDGMTIPLIVSGAFAMVVIVTEALVWRFVATKHPDSLPSFFMGVSGFRLLLAIGTMFVFYLIADRKGMLTFFLTFAAFYVMMLIHHSVFFARISNRS